MKRLAAIFEDARGFFHYERSYFKAIAVVLSAFSCGALIIASDSALCSAFNVLASIVLLLFPESYVLLIVSSSVSSSISIFGFSATYYYLFILLLYVLIKSKFRIRKFRGGSSVLLALFLLWLNFSAYFSIAGTLPMAIKLSIMIVICYLCAYSRVLKLSEFLFFVKKAAPIILAIILAKLFFSPVPYVIEGNYTLTTGTTVAPDINPNQIAQYISLLFFISFSSLNDKSKALSIVGVLLSFIILLLLKSRTSLYAALAISAIYFFFVLKTRLLYKLIISAGVVSFFVLRLLTTQIDPASAIANGDDKDMSVTAVMESGGSGRIFTWEEVITSIIPNYPVHGIGIGVENYEALGLEFDSDNLYLDLLAETGFVGFLFFFLFFIFLIKELNRHKSSNCRLSKYLFLMIPFFGIGETMFDSFFMWSIVFICYICINSKYDNNITQVSQVNKS